MTNRQFRTDFLPIFSKLGTLALEPGVLKSLTPEDIMFRGYFYEVTDSFRENFSIVMAKKDMQVQHIEDLRANKIVYDEGFNPRLTESGNTMFRDKESRDDFYKSLNEYLDAPCDIVFKKKISKIAAIGSGLISIEMQVKLYDMIE